ncbi:MAG TPA: bifunctional UDP-3-O-[3-hydroxymyristoyl] N-acetylglucosamine deacetylase/3-hydroxyacyl-ACP dehydratase [Bacteroidales bacterium]|nr:bifunctional UDP-3-O-[3-hydroxymyristoyl] N-acetylglucosamine deacetylase/3-hydroxyacyl-ACP dehydratase [Bacteroidales bacterium]
MTEKQRTILKPVTLKGNGLHSGEKVELTIHPAADNHGYVFKRSDLEGNPTIRAVAENVVLTERGTTLEEKNVRVSTIEHLMATLYAMGIDNVLLELNGPEVPIMDGSAVEFVKAIKSVGTVEQESERKYFQIKNKMVFRDEKKGLEITGYPDDTFSIDVHIGFDSKILDNQFARLSNFDEFETQIAPCRTFVFLREVELLFKNNLIKGGDLNNAIVIIDRKISQEELDRLAELFHKPKIRAKPEGVLNNIELHFSNEPARHKLLDIIGDLALVGTRLKGKIIANKPGHYVNTEFAKILRKEVKHELSKPIPPEYDPNKPPVCDINDIMKKLPHRPPFLLVDRITYLDDWTVCGIKNVTMNEAFFAGHFPDEPIMPGVLQIEAMAQVGGILLMSMVPDPENYVLYFMKIENVKFKQKVVPGDTLNVRMILKEPVRRGIALTYGQGFIGDKLAIECEFMAQLSRKPGV